MPTRAQIYRRRRAVVFGGAALILVVLLYLPFTLLAPLGATAPTLTGFAVTPGAAAAPVYPSYGSTAVGAVGWDGLLASSDADEVRPMASVTKTIVALLVLEAKPLKTGEAGPTITLGPTDVAFYNSAVAQNGTVAAAKAGMTFTEHEMLSVMLVKSANNYAMSMARWAYGSTDAYLAAAKKWVADHGLTRTTVADVAGLDSASTSTASDLVALGRLVLANPVLADIVDEKSFQIHDLGTVSNTNKLLGHSGIVGIKTGTLISGATTIANLLFATEFRVGGHEVTVIGVVLGGPNHKILDADIKSLIASVKAGFHSLPLGAKGRAVADYATRWGQRSTAVIGESRSVLVWSDTPVTSRVEAEKLSTSARGSRVGTVDFTAGTTVIRVPLTLSRAITDPGPGWRLMNPFTLAG